MRYFAGTALMTSFGEAAKLESLRWNVALDLGSIPRLSEEQQRVGFGGFKDEDLNKSPLFGRLRAALGLPYDWVAEIGYTPPLEIHGSRARNLFALAVGRRLLETDAWTLSMRAVGQTGEVEGDITCPERIAGMSDPRHNPYGCRAPSRDVFSIDYYGGDATLAWDAGGGWKWHASTGIARTRLAVQVDALVFTRNDRSRLSSNGNLAWVAIGVWRGFDVHWGVGAELLYVPLDVRRPPNFSLEKDPVTSVRVQLRYSPD